MEACYMTSDDVLAIARAGQDYKDGAGPYDNPYLPGTDAFQSWEQEMDRLLLEEQQREQEELKHERPKPIDDAQ